MAETVQSKMGQSSTQDVREWDNTFIMHPWESMGHSARQTNCGESRRVLPLRARWQAPRPAHSPNDQCVCLLSPLIITREQIDEMFDILEEAIAEVQADLGVA